MLKIIFLFLGLVQLIRAEDGDLKRYSSEQAVIFWENGLFQQFRSFGYREIRPEDDISSLPTNAQTAYKLLKKEQQDVLERYNVVSLEKGIRYLETKLKPHQSIWRVFWLVNIYEGYQSAHQIQMLRDLETLRKTFNEIPTNPVAAWLQWLFPSHLEGIIIPNYCHTDPIGELVQDTSGKLINRLLSLMIDYSDNRIGDDDFLKQAHHFFGNFLLATGKEKKAVQSSFKDIFGEDLVAQNDLPKLSFLRSRISSKDRENYLIRVKDLTQTLLKALLYQRNAEKYPENIVQQSLLAYLYVRWENAVPFERLTILRPVPQDTLLWAEEKGNSALTHYHGGIRINQSQPFYDCAESTVLNMIRLSVWDGQCFDEKRLISLFSAGPRLSALQSFFKTYPRAADLHRHLAHQAFTEIVSDLNKDTSPVQVIYAKDDSKINGTPGPDKKYEIYGHGIVNLLNVFALLTQDPILLTPWPSNEISRMQQAHEKFNQLLQLLYGETVFRELSDREQKLQEAGILKLFPQVQYEVKGRKVILNIDPLHFDLLDADKFKGDLSPHPEQRNIDILDAVHNRSNLMPSLVSSCLYWLNTFKFPKAVYYRSNAILFDCATDSAAMMAWFFLSQTFLKPWQVDLITLFGNQESIIKLTLFLSSLSLTKLSESKFLKIGLSAPIVYTGYTLATHLAASASKLYQNPFDLKYFYSYDARHALGSSILSYTAVKFSGLLNQNEITQSLSMNIIWYAMQLSPESSVIACELLALYNVIEYIKHKTGSLLMAAPFIILISYGWYQLMHTYITHGFSQYFLEDLPLRLICNIGQTNEYTTTTYCW